MKKTWIGLSLAAALCLPLAGCAGDKTGSEIDPGGTVSPTAQTTPTATPGGTDSNGVTGGVNGDDVNTNAANGGNNVSDAPVGDAGTQRSVTRGANTNIGTGRADDSALERIGDGIKDTLDDMGNGARSMAQDAKRAME